VKLAMLDDCLHLVSDGQPRAYRRQLTMAGSLRPHPHKPSGR
jgi:hypothetical protein